MNKLFSSISVLLISTFLFAQRIVEPTNELRIFGLVDSEITFAYEKICSMEYSNIGNIKITNQEGEFKMEYKNLKGVSVLSLLNQIKIKTTKPKELNTFYFVFTASDGYTAVFSWNEIFNTEIGKGIFIITEEDQQKLTKSADRILLISKNDINTGRRHIRALKSIEVKKV